ncbi:glutamate--tRNA ligase [Alphaproteobacteria bacterium]|nr:glutamate--tRNA ligase [Alphaproteobacteria bacterium]
MTKVRFAPSPTGYLHIGNFRTALINFLFAKNKNGHFMLRIDDTDDERSLPKYEDSIKEDLNWMGINWNSLEKQSSRLSFYDLALQKLLDKKRAYPCFETAEELSLKRKRQLSSGKPPIYDRAALKLSDSDIADFKAKGRIPHYRFLLDHSDVNWNDLVKGVSQYNMSNLSDPVIIREDGRVIYTLASVVDDIDFEVTDILRGEDHMTNSAAQIQLFEALESSPPNLGHLSLLTDITGAGLSKRIGSLSLRDLKTEGFQPMAISSLLSKVGTSDAVDIFKDINQIIFDFDISKFGKSKPKFDKNELKGLNSKFFKLLDYADIKDQLNIFDFEITSEFWELMKGNIDDLSNLELWWNIIYGTIEPIHNDESFINTALESLPEGRFDKNTWASWINILTKETGRKGKELFNPIRMCLTGQRNGPEMATLVWLMGRDKVIERLTIKSL